MGLAAWRYGWFFDADAYRIEWTLFAAGIAAAAYVMRHPPRPADAGDPLVWLLPLAMAACYGAALLSGPASVQGTVDAMLRWTALAGWFAALSVWRRLPGSRPWGEAAIHVSGLFLLLGGWLGWYGVLSFPDIVQRFDDPELSATGVRLAGFLQYPNAYGAALAFFLLRWWQIWAGSDAGTADNRTGGRSSRVRLALSSLFSIPYGGALALTESRGSTAALLAGFLLALLLAGGRQARIRLALAAVWTAVAAWAAARGAVIGTEESAAWGGGLTAAALIAGIAVMYAMGLWLEKLERRDGNTRRLSIGWESLWPVMGLLLAAGIYAWRSGWLPGGRLAGGNYETASSRMLFYRDGWNLFRDSPWLGWGGDGWGSLFGLYQSLPYVGSEVHNGYLDVLLDVGMLGLACLAGLLAYGLWSMWKNNHSRVAIAPAAVLLIHAAVDFDMSYGWTWLLLLAWIAMFASVERTTEAARPPGALRRLAARGAAALLLGASAWGAWAAWHADAAARAYAAADREAAPAAREAKLRAALAANPADGRIRLALAPLLPLAGERASVLAAGRRYEPSSAPLQLQLGLAEAELGLEAQAETSLREALRLDRFNREAQTAAVAGMMRLADALRFQDRDAEARMASEAAVSFYEEYRRLAQQVEAMDHPANDRRFEMTDAAEYHAARAYAELGRLDEARGLLARLAEGTTDWGDQARQLLDTLDRPGR